MLVWAAVFLAIAAIAIPFGFGSLAGAAAGIAQILFVVFIALSVLALLTRAFRELSSD